MNEDIDEDIDQRASALPPGVRRVEPAVSRRPPSASPRSTPAPIQRLYAFLVSQ